jgi:transcriptional regulator with XRE-family HTH domain
MRRTIGQVVKTLRRRLHWRQQDLAERARTSRQTISRIERDLLAAVPVGTLERVVEAVDARLRFAVDWHGEQLDRLIDANHARLQNAVVELLESFGWLVRVEVSFNHYGDRGRYDILAFHPLTGRLLIIEIKVGIGDVQDLLGRLDVKVRLARSVAAQFDWKATQAIPMLVIAEESTSRRIVRRHEALFRQFALRGRSATSWLRTPNRDVSGLLLFHELSNARVVGMEQRKSR